MTIHDASGAPYLATNPTPDVQKHICYRNDYLAGHIGAALEWLEGVRRDREQRAGAAARLEEARERVERINAAAAAEVDDA